MLSLTDLSGFGASSGGGLFVFTDTISVSTNNYNVQTAMTAAGWNGTDPFQAAITINSGVTVGSTSTGMAAFVATSTFPAGSSLSVTNNGTIQGKGGDGVNGRNISSYASPLAGTNGNAGGTALAISCACTFDNLNGSILGGGGSGAGGASAGLRLNVDKDTYCYCTGGSGSGGGRGTTGGASSSGGTASGGGCSIANGNLNGNTGSAGTASANGTGGAAAQQNNLGITPDAYCRGAAGGNGGAAGSAGANSSASTASVGSNAGTTYTASGATGGAAGNAVTGNSNITWTNSGTITGPVS